MHKKIQNLIQRIWERHTPAGAEFVAHKARELKYAAVTAQGDASMLINSLQANGFHVNGYEIVGSLGMYTLTSTDDEIHIFLHRDKGDLYGVYRQVRSNSNAQIVKLLTDTTANHQLSERLDELRRAYITHNIAADLITVDDPASLDAALRIFIARMRD